MLEGKATLWEEVTRRGVEDLRREERRELAIQSGRVGGYPEPGGGGGWWCPMNAIAFRSHSMTCF